MVNCTKNKFDLPAYDDVFKLQQILKEQSIEYWVDSGTLLSLIRDQKLLIDDDFDISVAIDSDDEKNLEILIYDNFEVVTGYYLNGRVFKYKIISVDGFIIDLNVFRDINGVLCCPQRIRPVYWYYFPKWLKRLVSSSLSKGEAGIKKVNFRPHSWLYLSYTYTWLVPIRYLGNFSECSITGMNIPEFYEEYLEYRYGDWRTPNTNWLFSRDDTGITSHSLDTLNALGGLYR